MIGHAAVDVARLQSDIEALAEFREPGEAGWTRRVFSAPYVASRDWLAGRMRDAGLEVRRDAAGNLVGTMAAAPPHDPERRGPALVTGSHTDTVAGGGRFDGPAGVLGALEAARCIQESGAPLAHDLRVVDFVGEEPNDFGLSCVGSRAVAGTLMADHLALRNPAGQSLAQALATIGGDPEGIECAAWRPDEVLAYVELHIEQGPVLEAAGIPVGVVTGIVGIERVRARFDGAAGHAGTTPMRARHDALCAAAEVVLAVERIATEHDAVGTAGRIEAAPGALNVIPGHVDVWIELRHTGAGRLAAMRNALEAAVAEAGSRRGVAARVEGLSRTQPVLTSEAVRAAMTRAAHGLGFEPVTIASGAGHDAVQMARLGPVGMLFVPSVGGRSHCPEELTHPADLGAGVAALVGTLRALDAG